MFSFSELYSRFFNLHNQGHRSTFYSVFALSAVGVLITTIIYFAFLLIQIMIGVGMGLAASEGGGGAADTGLSILSLVLQILQGVIGAAVSSVIMVAITKAAVQFFNGEEVGSMALVKSSLSYAISSQGLKLSVFFAIGSFFAGIGSLFCIVPGLVISFVVGLAMFRAVDLGEPISEAVKGGWAMIKSDFVTSILYILVGSIGLMLVVLFTCGIGGLFASGLMILLYGSYYASLLGKPIFS